MPEVIRDGESGFLVEDVDESARRLRDIPQIDRAQCRRRVEARFSWARMVEDCLAVYRKVLSQMCHDFGG